MASPAGSPTGSPVAVELGTISETGSGSSSPGGRRRRASPPALNGRWSGTCLCALFACIGLELALLALAIRAYDAIYHRDVRRCEREAHEVWENPNGVSEGLSVCIRKFAEHFRAGTDAYKLIDKADVPGVRRQPLERFSIPWQAALDPHSKDDWQYLYIWDREIPKTGKLDSAEWVLPPGYRQKAGEVRIVFVHGGSAQLDASGPEYAGLTMRVANWTSMPVFAFNYLTEPTVPWPANVRSVFTYLEYALWNGPESHGRAGSIILLADSEGTLVAMHTVLVLYDSKMLQLLGFHHALKEPKSWLAGIVLSSPVVDVACLTESFEWNCFDDEWDTGDPDVGDCSQTPTMKDRIQDCRWQYLVYFYGSPSLSMARNNSAAGAAWEARRDFFEQGLVNPMRADLAGFPPMLLLGGPRDYYYSDTPNLASRACRASVQVETFSPVGTFHDFLEYSEGCGGQHQMEEAIESYRRIRKFAHTSAHALRQNHRKRRWFFWWRSGAHSSADQT